MSQELEENKCVLVQLKSVIDRTPWKNVSEVSPCPFDETGTLTPQTTFTISTEGSTATRSVTGKQVDKKHMKAAGVNKKDQDGSNKERATRISSDRNDTSSTNKTNKTVAKHKLDKPGVSEKAHAAEPTIRPTTIKGEKKQLAEKLVNATDPSKINKKNNGDVENVIGGTLRIILANIVMLFMTIPFFN